jgi:CHAT domain-containing protein/tetratricopeptide (TPR) repeat protein
MGRSSALAVTAITALFLAFSGALLLRPSVPPPPRGTTELRLGEVLSRHLNASGADTFAIWLRSGDFLGIVVEQKGLDLVVSLADPNAAHLLEVNRRTDPLALEPVEAVTETAGWHLLRVHPVQTGASGRYVVRLEKLQPAGLRERSRARAARIFAAGEALWKKGELGRARKAYLAALQNWRDMRETRGMADAHARLGAVAAGLNDLSGARGAYHEAIALYRRLRDPEEIRLLNELGRVCYRTDPQAAEEAYSQALRLARGRGDRVLEGRALNNLGVLYDSQAAPRKALEAFDQALEIWRSLGDRAEEATTLHNLGFAYTVLGRLPQALEMLEQALRLRRAVNDIRGEGATLTALAWVHTLEGNLREALPLYDNAILLRQTVGDWRGEAVTIDRRGTALARMGRYSEAAAAYRRVLEILRHHGEPPGSEAPTLANMGWLLLASGDPRQGEQLLESALPYLRHSSNRHGEAHTLMGLAEAARQRGDLARALERVEESIALVESLRREAPGMDLRVSYGAQRYGYYELWIDLLMELHRRRPAAGFDIRALEANELGRGFGLRESLSRELAMTSSAPPQKAHPLEARIQKLESFRFQLLEGGAPPESLETVGRKLSALLLERDRLRAEPPAGGPGVHQHPLGEFRELLGTDTLLLEYAVGEERSFLWLLGADGLETRVLPGRAALAAQTHQVHELLSRRSRRSSRRVEQKATAALGQTLLGPIADRLTGMRLLIVPDGPLYAAPFAALQVRPEGPPLLVEHEIVLAPSASALVLLRREQSHRTPAAGDLALIADPVFGADDPRLQGAAASRFPVRESLRSGRERRLPRLPQTRREAEAILRLLSPSATQVAALDFAADRGAVLDGLLDGYRIIHFATHSILEPEQPELSSLVLSLVDAAGRPRDGFLRAYEIRDLHLSADLVVLSACSTGVGRELRGEGPLSLSRAFLGAGASRVVVSLWDVEDKPTAELMSRFYQGYLASGLSPAQALRQAQLSLWREPRWAEPYYWAGFVLEGDWR